MLSHDGNQSESKSCCQNYYVEATEDLMLAKEDAKTWEGMEVSMTHVYTQQKLF